MKRNDEVLYSKEPTVEPSFNPVTSSHITHYVSLRFILYYPTVYWIIQSGLFP
jgi:hypothetical protein